MSKVYCKACFAELPDYAHFCRLCGTRQPGGSGALAHGDPPQPASRKFDTEFAPSAAGLPHSDDATVPVSRSALQAEARSQEGQALVGPTTDYDTSPLAPFSPVASSSPLPADSVLVPGREGYSDPYYAPPRPQKDLDAIAGHATFVVKRDDVLSPLPVQVDTPIPAGAEHHQPQLQRAEHHQPQVARASGQQPPAFRLLHEQPEGPRRRSRITLTQAVRYSALGTCVLLLVAIFVMLTNPFLRTKAQIGRPSPALTTMNATSVFPGGAITLHGANFTPGATVTFSSDGVNLALAAPQISLSPASSSPSSLQLATLALDARLVRWQGDSFNARVQYDGTFDVTLSLPQSWQANSSHKLLARESSSNRTAFVDVTVLNQQPSNGQIAPIPTAKASSVSTPQQQQALQSHPTPQPISSPSPAQNQQAAASSPTPAPTPVPQSVTQCVKADQYSLAFKGDNGYKGHNPGAQTITVTNCGSAGIVTAAVSSDSLSWLSVSGGGKLSANAKTTISVSADALKSKLSSGPHSGIVYVSIKTDDGNSKNIAINVLFNVTSTAQPTPTPSAQPTPTISPQPLH